MSQEACDIVEIHGGWICRACEARWTTSVRPRRCADTASRVLGGVARGVTIAGGIFALVVLAAAVAAIVLSVVTFWIGG